MVKKLSFTHRTFQQAIVKFIFIYLFVYKETFNIFYSALLLYDGNYNRVQNNNYTNLIL